MGFGLSVADLHCVDHLMNTSSVANWECLNNKTCERIKSLYILSLKDVCSCWDITHDGYIPLTFFIHTDKIKEFVDQISKDKQLQDEIVKNKPLLCSDEIQKLFFPYFNNICADYKEKKWRWKT